jgi:predicted transcriptional regulator
MTEPLSIRLDSDIKPCLTALARHSKRSKPFLAAEAIAAFAEQEEWQPGEIRAAIDELDKGQGISYDKVASWLRSWGKTNEKNAPR